MKKVVTFYLLFGKFFLDERKEKKKPANCGNVCVFKTIENDNVEFYGNNIQFLTRTGNVRNELLRM